MKKIISFILAVTMAYPGGNHGADPVCRADRML